MRTASRSSNSRCPTLQGHDIHPRFATIPSPVIRYLINDFGKIVGYLTLSPQAHALVANLLTLNPPSSKLSGTCPLAKASLSRRQQFITRFARLNKQRSGDFRLSPSANFANSAILPTDKISAFFMQNFLLQKPKDSSWSMPLISPRGKNDRLR